MTAIRLTYIYCDGEEDCLYRYEAWDNAPEPRKGAAYQRRHLRVYGWTYSRGKDYCPDCSMKRKQKARDQ